MAEYRDRTTSAIKSQGQLRKENPNMSLPKVWNANVLDALNVDAVIKTYPSIDDIGPYQRAVRGPIVQNADGEWEESWDIVDMFSDDEELGTKAEQEAAYQERIDDGKAQNHRSERDRLLKETDWWAMPDSPEMTAEQATYRQALRDISSHANWPYLKDADWPVKP